MKKIFLIIAIVVSFISCSKERFSSSEVLYKEKICNNTYAKKTYIHYRTDINNHDWITVFVDSNDNLISTTFTLE